MGRESILLSSKNNLGEHYYKPGVTILNGDELFITNLQGKAVPVIDPGAWIIKPECYEEEGDVVLNFSELLEVMY